MTRACLRPQALGAPPGAPKSHSRAPSCEHGPSGPSQHAHRAHTPPSYPHGSPRPRDPAVCVALSLLPRSILSRADRATGVLTPGLRGPGSGWVDRAGTRRLGCSMRFPPVCNTSSAGGKEGRSTAGWNPHFYSGLWLLQFNRREYLQGSPPGTHPPFEAGAEPRLPLSRQPAFAKQPGALGLCFPTLFGCYGSCFRKTFPANNPGFLGRVWVRAPCRSAGWWGQKGRGCWKPRLTTPLQLRQPYPTHPLLLCAPEVLVLPQGDPVS